LERDVITTVDNTCQVINSTADAPFFEWTSDFGYSSEEYAPLIEFPNSDPRRFEICLTAINENNCRDSTCRSLTMINEYLFWAPNCFTPDGDQINDYFAIQMQGFELESYTLTIYDRWGIQVFESNQWQEPWIGDIQKGSHFAPSDTYTWVVKVKDKEQADYQTFKGHITLIR
jgi:gliding motility-associated-like protein